MPDVNITIKTINDSERGTRSAIGSFTELSSAVNLAGQALQVAKQAYEHTTGAAVKYAAEVRDVVEITGLAASESSRLVQLLDDFEISTSTVQTAIRAMTKQGLSPTVETLAKLSDEYLSLNDAQEKNAFIFKNFGRSGLQWINLLKQGGQAITDLNSASNENLILTDEQLAQTEAYRLQLDSLKDSLQGLQVQAGLKTMPVLIDMMNVQNDGARAAELAAEKGINLVSATREQRNEFMSLAIAERKATLETDNHIDVLTEQAELIKEVDYTNIIQGAIQAAAATKQYRDSQAEIKTQIQELKAEQQELYPWQISKIQETQASIDELSATYEENAAAFVQAMEQKFAMMAIEKIAMSDGVAGYSEAEFEKAQAILKTTDVATAASFEQAQAMETLTSAVAEGKISTEAYGKITKKVMEDGVVTMQEVQETMDSQMGAIADSYKEPLALMTTFNEKIKAAQNLSGSVWTYMFDIQVNGSVPNLPYIDRPPGGSGGGVQQNQQFAMGGSFVVPPQYGVEGFNMGGIATATAGEVVTITPKGEAGAQGGFNNYGTINVFANSPDEFMQALTGGEL